VRLGARRPRTVSNQDHDSISHAATIWGATMEREPNHPLNTREFTTKWHGIVEEHVVPSLAAILPRLMTGAASDNVPAERWDDLARHLAHALQIASTSGGAQAAVDYLQQIAGPPPGDPR
jgi:hypothetical protein